MRALTRYALPLSASFMCLTLTACDAEQSSTPPADMSVEGGSSAALCPFDENSDVASAAPLSVGEGGASVEPLEGYLCPFGDHDWYTLSMTAPSVLEVRAEVEGGVSPLALYYELYQREGDSLGEQVGALPPSLASSAISASHCLAPAELALKLSDLGDDAQDKRSPYHLSATLSAEPDEGELGAAEGLELARPLSPENPQEGVISCLGDADWFKLSVPARSLLTWRLEMPTPSEGDGGVAGREALSPRVRLLNAEGQQLFAHRRGLAQGSAPLTHTLSVAEESELFLVVDEESGLRADRHLRYQLSVSVSEDNDLNEPNDQPSEATRLSSAPLRCEPTWSEWLELEGSVGVLGDSDWVALPVEGCGRGLIEAEVSLNDDALSAEVSFALQQELSLSLSLLKAHEPSACSFGQPGADESCRVLNKSCGEAWGCAGLGGVCGAEGACRGPARCLPSGVCAATQIERHYTLPMNVTPQALPPHYARLSAPIKGDGTLYLKVSDVGSNAASPDARYRLKVRLRRDPDRNEPSNVYTDEIRRGDPIEAQVRFAQRRPWVYVHECSEGVYAPEPVGGAESGSNGGAEKVDDMGMSDMGVSDMEPLDMGFDLGVSEPLDMAPLDMAPLDMAPIEEPAQGELWPSCCLSDQARWTEGALSYEDDQDLYTYAHPCPGEDCMVTIYYELDEGPVDMLWQLYQGEDLWFDPIVPVAELPINAALSGQFGGLQEGDACLYAWQGHMSSEEGTPFLYTLSIRDLRPTRDWSSEQRYRFCIEKSGNGCFEPPCELSDPPTEPGRVGGCRVPRP